jgi:hypothetical protein
MLEFSRSERQSFLMCVQLVELLFELFKLLPSFSEIASLSASTSCYHLLKLHAHSSLLGLFIWRPAGPATCDNRSRATSRSHSSRSLIIYDDCSRITGNSEVRTSLKRLKSELASQNEFTLDSRTLKLVLARA